MQSFREIISLCSENYKYALWAEFRYFEIPVQVAHIVSTTLWRIKMSLPHFLLAIDTQLLFS
jgi:hypothetical protein